MILALSGVANVCNSSPSSATRKLPAQSNPSHSPSSTAQPRTLIGHTNAVLSIAFSRDGRLMVTASSGRTVNIWDVRTGAIRRTLTGQPKTVWSVDISRDGKMVASGSDDGYVQLWDVQTGRLLRTIAHGGQVYSVAFSPNGKSIATGSRVSAGYKAIGGRVNVWEVSTGKALKTLSSPLTVKAVAFSSDGKLLLAGGADQKLRLWNARTEALLHTFTGHDWKGYRHGIDYVAFSLDSKVVASGGWGKFNQACLWNARTGALLHVLPIPTGGIQSLAFSPNGKIVATATHPKVQIWNIRTGKLLREWKDKAGVRALAFTPDGKHLVAGGAGGSERINSDRTVTSDVHGVIEFWPVG
ncbi:hypothetical protein IAD21_01593 [Abditibacteriota bacterium]|nr:hypothetical protein IAD21_01593 [Abditibacteriota bacterium]